MRITKIEPQKKRKDRYNIYIDDEFYFGLDENVVLKFGLREKDEIDKELIERIEGEEVVAKAYNATVNFLKTRERSKKEISDKLKTKEYSLSVIKKILAKLENLDLVNDKRFAQMFVRDRIKLKPKGKRVLRLELKQKGIDGDIIEKVLEDILDKKKESELVEKVFKKIESRYSNLPPAEQKQKIIKYLLGKGFEWNIIERVVD